DAGESAEAAVCNYLRQVKAQLARQYGVLETHLRYTRLLGRKRTSEGLVVELEIIKQEIRKGTPIFRLESITGPDGTLFADMVLKVTLFPYDDFDKPLTRALLEYYLSQKGIQWELLNWPVLNKALETLQTADSEITDLTAGHGILPDFGTNAVLEYALPVSEKKQAFSAQIGARRVKTGDMLIRRIPASVGLKVGLNLLGRELAPRRGWDVELAAGMGTKLSPDDCLLTAADEGLARFERSEQTIRRFGKVERVPARIVATVEPLHTIEGHCVLQLDWDGHLEINGDVLSGSRVKASGVILVHGDIQEHCELFSADSICVDGKISGSLVESDGYLVAQAASSQAEVKAAKKVLILGTVEDSCIQAQDVHLGEVRSSQVRALHEFHVDKVDDSAETDSEIIVNLREFLGLKQVESADMLRKMGETMQRLIELFGPTIVQTVSATNVAKVLHQFLREQKKKGIPPYSAQEIVHFRTMLELIPTFRDLLADVGQELCDLTHQILTQEDQELLFIREPIVSSNPMKSDS
ncbi:MAG: flagellar assembly protein A, partial [bacterium]